MITKAELLTVRSLRNRASREEHGLFLVEGWKGIMELLDSPLKMKRIYIRSGVIPPEGFHLPDASVTVSQKEMDRMSQMKTPPGVLATVEIPSASAPPSSASELTASLIPLVIVCDGITDPGNLGTIIRTAEWFGFAGVICDPKGVDPWNSKCLQASMGSAFRLPIWTQSTSEWSASWEGPIWSLDAGGIAISTIQWAPGALAIGSESHGLSAHMKLRAKEVIGIPGAGITESLNAAVAGSISMFQISQSYLTL